MPTTTKVQQRHLLGWKGVGCQHCGMNGHKTRHYGEEVVLDDGSVMWTGWRGPYCSIACYRVEHPVEVPEDRAVIDEVTLRYTNDDGPAIDVVCTGPEGTGHYRLGPFPDEETTVQNVHELALIFQLTQGAEVTKVWS